MTGLITGLITGDDATGDGDDLIGELQRTIEFMRTEDDRCPGSCGFTQERVDEVASLLVKAGMGFIQQPQFRSAGDEAGQGGTSTLTGGETGDGDGPQSPVKTETGERSLDIIGFRPGGPGPETHVVTHSEIVIETSGVAEESHTMAHGAPIGGEIDPENRGLPAGDGHQSGQGSQQCGLPRSVGSPQQHDPAGIDIEIDAGQSGEPAQQSDRSPEMDHGRRLGGVGGGGRMHGDHQPYPWPVRPHQAARWCPGIHSR